MSSWRIAAPFECAIRLLRLQCAFAIVCQSALHRQDAVDAPVYTALYRRHESVRALAFLIQAIEHMARIKATPTLQQIEEQIAALQRQRDAMQSSERIDVIDKIKVAIAHYGLTADDLGLSGTAKRGKKFALTSKAAPAGKVQGRIKYRDDAGNSWSGFGRKPRWLVEAVAGGKALSDLLA